MFRCPGHGHRAVGLVNLQAGDKPIHVCERAGMVLYKILARGCKGGTGSRSGPDSAGPITTEGCVENLTVISMERRLVMESDG